MPSVSKYLAPELAAMNIKVSLNVTGRGQLGQFGLYRQYGSTTGGSVHEGHQGPRMYVGCDGSTLITQCGPCAIALDCTDCMEL